MLVLWDNMTALLVGGVVALMLFTVHMSVQQSTVERTVVYTAKSQTLAFADVLEQDLIAAGFGVQPGEEALLVHSEASADDVTFTNAFEFIGIDENLAQTRIRYEAAVVDSVEMGGEMVPLLEVQRFQGDGITWTPDGGSPATLTDFDIHLLDENNNGASRQDARRLRVRFENAVPLGLGGETYLRRMYWSVTLNPMGLMMQGYQG